MVISHMANLQGNLSFYFLLSITINNATIIVNSNLVSIYGYGHTHRTAIQLLHTIINFLNTLNLF